MFRNAQMSFSDAANPAFFESNPRKFWFFYGHRFNTYLQTNPHAGFALLRSLLQNKEHFVFTSNVDSQFQRAGFAEDKVAECHGSIFHWQCNACYTMFKAADHEVAID